MGDIVELSATVVAGYSIIGFVLSRHVSGDLSGSRINHWTRTTRCTTMMFTESHRLPCSLHHGSKLVRLSFPFSDRFCSLCPFDLLVNSFSLSCQPFLLTIYNSLVSCIEYFALLTEDFLADILMSTKGFWVERSSAIVALLETICPTATTSIALLLWHLSFRIGVRT